MVQYVSAQASVPIPYTDADTGIVFNTWSAANIRFGLTFPGDGKETNADEFIGIIVREEIRYTLGYR